jgi:hypothetical protein
VSFWVTAIAASHVEAPASGQNCSQLPLYFKLILRAHSEGPPLHPKMTRVWEGHDFSRAVGPEFNRLEPLGLSFVMQKTILD